MTTVCSETNDSDSQIFLPALFSLITSHRKSSSHIFHNCQQLWDPFSTWGTLINGFPAFLIPEIACIHDTTAPNASDKNKIYHLGRVITEKHHIIPSASVNYCFFPWMNNLHGLQCEKNYLSCVSQNMTF